MRAVDYPQLAADYPHKKAVAGATAGECEVNFILLNPNISDCALSASMSKGGESARKCIGTPISFNTENCKRKATFLKVELGQTAIDRRPIEAKELAGSVCVMYWLPKQIGALMGTPVCAATKNI